MSDVVRISVETIVGLVDQVNAALEEAAEHLTRHRDLEEARKVSMGISITPDKKQAGVYSVEFKVETKVPSERRGGGVALLTRAGYVGMMAPQEQTDIEAYAANVVQMREAAEGGI